MGYIYEICKFSLLVMLTGIAGQVFAQLKDFVELKGDSVTVFVKDTADYSKEYLHELLQWDLSKKYILNEDSLIIDRQHDYALFYTGLEKDVSYEFHGMNDLFEISLIVTRINYSTIQYKAKIVAGDKAEEIGGIAHGGVSLLGTESDEDDSTGIGYFCAEYTNSWKHWGHSIRIDSDKSTRAKIIVNDDSKIGVKLENCPTLRLIE